MHGASRVRLGLLLVAITAVVIAVAWRWHSAPTPLPESAPQSPGPRSADAPTSRKPSSPIQRLDQQDVEPAVAMALRIEDVYRKLTELAARRAGTAERAAAAQALRIELRGAGHNASAEAIAHFLESGRDAPTGMPFAPALDGSLETAPSLRTMLLDELEQLDATLAREAAERVFTQPHPAADEWSIALRIAARDGATARAEFRTRVLALLENAAWQHAPTPGYLHGFDAAVYSGDIVLVDRLAALADRHDETAVRFAAQLALDRMAMVNFPGVAAKLVHDPALLSAEPRFRGMLFARADVSEAPARLVLEQFLRSTSPTSADLQTWANYFPHRSKHISNNLLTADRPTPAAELARMDRAALSVVREWRSDPTLSHVEPLLATVQTRLEQYVASADRGDAARAASPAAP